MKKAFTLIEMLIVVVIIGILASALIPRIASARARATNAELIKDLRDIQTALELYKMDYNVYPSAVTCSGNIGTDCGLSGIYAQISPYLTSLPKGDTNLGQWILLTGYFSSVMNYKVPAASSYGYIGKGDKYILAYKFVDTRDNQVYRAVWMPDKKRWMAENLNYITDTSKCRPDRGGCGNGNGRVYTWYEAQSVCPPSWRLPNDNEWLSFLNAIEGNSLINHTQFSNSYSCNARLYLGEASLTPTNSVNMFGFSALGVSYYNGSSFISRGIEASNWTSTSGIVRGLLGDDSSSNYKCLHQQNVNLSYQYPVRCIRD